MKFFKYLCVFCGVLCGLMSMGVACKNMTPQHSERNPSNPMKKIAVLPLQNDTTDVDGPEIIREKIIFGLQNKMYDIMPVKEVDQLLRDKLGVSIGGQVQAVKPEILKSALGVDGAVYGTLMDFDTVTIGVYNVSKVRAKFRMVDTQTGKVFWKNGIGIRSKDQTNDWVGKATATAAEMVDDDDPEAPWQTLETKTSDRGPLETLVMELGLKFFTQMTKTHLERESSEMAERVLNGIPAGPGQ